MLLRLHFYLKKPNKNKECQVYMQVTFNGQRVRHNLKHVSVRPQAWNSKTDRVRKDPKFIDPELADDYNLQMDELESSVNSLRIAIRKEKITLSKKLILDRILNPNDIAIDKRSFFSFFDEYIKANKSVKAKRTITGHQTSINFLKKYEESIGEKLTLFNIDLTFFESLRNYSYTEKGISTNYFARNIATLKAFMTWAFNKGYHSNLEYKKFVAPETKKEIIYLTRDELERLGTHHFDSARLSHARDIFCFICFTGLRFSDIKALTPAHISNNFIVKTIIKTQEINKPIPINRLMRKILDRYKNTIYEPLPKISNQKLNDYIKECCQIVGINDLVVEIKHSGKNHSEVIKEKWEVISSHIGRKTHGTQNRLRGLMDAYNKDSLGHKTDAQFNKYAKITDKEYEKALMQAWDDW